MPDRHRETKSKYTLDRGMPGAFEGETVTRRRLMVLAANGAGAVAVAAFTLPALGFAIAPIFKRQPWTWQPVGPPSDFTDTDYVTKMINIVPGIGEAGNSVAYVRKRNPGDRQGARGPVQPLRRPVRPVHAPGLPGQVRAGGAAVHLPVPRRRLRLPRNGRRGPAGPSARPLLHQSERANRPASRSARATRSTTSSSASRRATRASRSTASASTCTRPSSTRPSHRRTSSHAQDSRTAAAEGPPAKAEEAVRVERPGPDAPVADRGRGLRRRLARRAHRAVGRDSAG